MLRFLDMYLGVYHPGETWKLHLSQRVDKPECVFILQYTRLPTATLFAKRIIPDSEWFFREVGGTLTQLLVNLFEEMRMEIIEEMDAELGRKHDLDSTKSGGKAKSKTDKATKRQKVVRIHATSDSPF
jgi:hypothetical protein